MTRTHRRKIKSMIAEIIACVLSIILVVIMLYAVIGIMALVTFVIEHADIRAIIVTAVGAIIMMFLEFRKG